MGQFLGRDRNWPAIGNHGFTKLLYAKTGGNIFIGEYPAHTAITHSMMANSSLPFRS